MADNWKTILEANEIIKELALGVVAIVDIHNWERITDDYYRITEAFATGFLYSSNRIITAGHVIRNHKINNARIVFDFINDENGGMIISKINVHHIIDMSHNHNNFDCGLLVMNNNINRNALSVRHFLSKQGDSDSDDYDNKVFAIGHQGGQPARYSNIVNLRIVEDNQTIFISEFPAQEGASGSPVFSIRDNAIIGIVIESLQNQAKCLKTDTFI